MTDHVLELKNVTHGFAQGGSRLEILKGVDLTIARGEIVALLGPSGSGKTTLLQIAGLLENPCGGDVIINGKKVMGRADHLRTTLRRTQIGFVYQFHHLLPDFTAVENLLLPQYIVGTPKKQAMEKAMDLLDRVGLAARGHHYPSELSGGEQQRVAIVRGLVNAPALLLADEPTGNLDPHTAEGVFAVMMETIRSLNIGALLVTHNLDLAARMDRTLRLADGRIEV